MKNIKLFALLPLLVVSTLMGCNNNSGRPYQEDYIYTEDETFEPIDITKGDLAIRNVEFVGFPYNHEIKVADLDNTDSAVRVWYEDNTTKTVPLKMKNIPVEYRHLFGEIGEHSIELTLRGIKDTFNFTIVENPSFPGYNVWFYDRNKKLLDQKVVGYYQTATYNGKELPQMEEDGDYRYTLKGWNHPLTNIHQNTQFIASYDKLEKRWYAIRQYNRESTGLSSIVNKDKTVGSSLAYLGRINRVPAYYGPVQELDNEDLELEIEPNNYSSYIREYNEKIVKELIEYKVDPDYNSLLYGNVSEIVTHPEFATSFNPNYQFKGVKAYLETKEDVEISSEDPFDGTIKQITDAFNYLKPVIKKDAEKGYYRAAIIGSFDVYLDISFKKLKDHVYEIGDFNQFVIAPVKYSLKMDYQHSYDGNFGQNFDNKLTVSTKAIYYMADMIDWTKF